MKILDAQLLLYVTPDQFESCTVFYERVFGVTAFYQWNDGINDRGRKYRLNGMALVILAQERPFDGPTAPISFQLQVPDAEAFYHHVLSVEPQAITHSLFTRPYGWRMFRIVDPAGNHLNVYHIPES